MILINGGLVGAGNSVVVALYYLKGGGEVGNVGSYVSFLAVKLEEEVLAGSCFKLLCAKSNALEGNGKTYVVLEALACSELVGKIYGCNGLYSGIGYLEGTALGLLHSGVRSSNGSNDNGHTDLNAFFNGVFIELVAVVTALALKVSEEEVVSGVTKALGVHSNNYTLDNNVNVCFSVDVILEGSELVLRNGTVVRNGGGSAVTCGDGSGELVVVLGLRLFINIDGPFNAVLRLYCLNELVVNRPAYRILNTCDHYLTDYLVVRCGNSGSLFVERVNVCCSSSKVILYLGFFFFVILRLGSLIFCCFGCFGFLRRFGCLGGIGFCVLG